MVMREVFKNGIINFMYNYNYNVMKNFVLILAMLMATISATNLKAQESNNVEESNAKCLFKFTNSGLISAQNSSNSYVVYEIPGMSAMEIKAATMTTISSMYNSPKDNINNLSENMIQLEGYMSRVYYSVMNNGDRYPVDIAFNWVIQFKDGKIRFNTPTFKQIYITNVPIMGSLKLDMSKPIQTLIDKEPDRLQVATKFNNLIKEIGKKAKSANDW